MALGQDLKEAIQSYRRNHFSLNPHLVENLQEVVFILKICMDNFLWGKQNNGPKRLFRV